VSTPSSACGFEGWFEPISLSDLRSTYLGRRTLHASGSPALRSLIEAASSWTVDGLLERHKGDVVAWFHTSDGRHTSARVSPAAARELYQAGITLYLGGVPEVQAMVGEVAAALLLPRTSFFGALFCNKPNAETRAHFDPVDIFCVQLRGAKRWWVAENEQMPAPVRNWATLDPTEPDLRLLTSDRLPTDIPEGALAYDMTPGTALYVPRGHWHKTSSDQESMSLHIGYSSITYIDILLHALRTALTRESAFREAPYAFWDPAARTGNVARVRQLLQRAVETLAAVDAADIVPFTGDAAPADASTQFVRNALASVGLESLGGETDIAALNVNVHGYPNTRVTKLELSNALAAVTLRLAHQCGGSVVTASDATRGELDIAEDEAVELLELLERAGLVRRQRIAVSPSPG
jgi:50S ribosomal protein L16 3-hydroxylase